MNEGGPRIMNHSRYVRAPALAFVLAEGVESFVLVLRLVEVRLCLLVPDRWPHGLATCWFLVLFFSCFPT